MDREKLVYYVDNRVYDFRTFKTIRTFGKDIYEGNITLKEADDEQSYLAIEIDHIIKDTITKNANKKQQRKIVTKNLRDLLKGREMFLNGFKSNIFLTKSIGTGILNRYNYKLKVLTPKQIFQRLPIALAQVEAGNNSQNFLNAIRQIAYSLYQSEEITKKV